MLKNNNDKVIRRMAALSFTSGRRKNLVMAAAIALAAFLLFTTLTVGGTYVKMHKIQDIRMNGADLDALILGGFTEEQEEFCKTHKNVVRTGVEARAGYSEKTDKDDTLHTVLMWADEAYWKTFKKPALREMRGRYPQEINEVLVTKEALEDCGKGELDIGDKFALTYANANGSYIREFTICGVWEGYGDNRVFYVSKDFYEQSGYQMSDVDSGILYLKLKSSLLTTSQQNEFREQLNLGKQQYFSYAIGTEKSVTLLAGMVGLILMTCFSAYLLIYNILYLSVSGNIRYYGLLQTVGMTGKQVRRLLGIQMLFVGLAGMCAGIAAGFGMAFFVIPKVVKMLGIREDVEVVFHPLIFFLTAAVVGLTVWLGSRKPVKIADSISPVEALGYVRLTGRQAVRKTGRGNVLWRMAKEQLGKDKKKAAVVILSLAASLSVFLCILTLIESHGARTIASNYMDTDLVILNDTLNKDDSEKWKQVFTDGFIRKLASDEGIDEVHFITSSQIVMPWEPGFADKWMREFYETWMAVPYEEDKEKYQKAPEDFSSFIRGIDEQTFESLNRLLDTPVDKEKFEKGEVCILYKDRLALETADVKGEQLSFYLMNHAEEKQQLTIAGITDDPYFASPIGEAPVLIVSDSYAEKLTQEPYISKLAVTYKEEFDEKTEDRIKGWLEAAGSASDVNYESKIEEWKYTKKAQGNMMGVGIGIAVILAVIGIMNYINTVSGNIQNRLTELSIMESVGMTEKQVKIMLVREGLLYALISILLASTFGLTVTYILYQSLNYGGIPFQIPALPVFAVGCAVICVCAVTPLVIYRAAAGKGSIIERIREQ